MLAFNANKLLRLIPGQNWVMPDYNPCPCASIVFKPNLSVNAKNIGEGEHLAAILRDTVADNLNSHVPQLPFRHLDPFVGNKLLRCNRKIRL